MKWVQRIQTIDGVLHETPQAAKRHAEARYADKLLPLAGKLVQIGKYTAMADYLNNNLDQFLELRALKDDIVLVEEVDA